MIALMSYLLVGRATPVIEMGLSMPVVLCVALVVGLLALAFTSYRFVVGYLLAGMLYWLWVEGIHWLVVAVVPALAVSDSYILSVAVSLLPLMVVLARQPRSVRMNGKQVDSNQAQTRSTSSLYPEPTMRLAAGQRPFVLEKDTDFYQHFVRHTAVTER